MMRRITILLGICVNSIGVAVSMDGQHIAQASISLSCLCICTGLMVIGEIQNE